MKYVLSMAVVAAQVFCLACSSAQRAQTKVSRQPLEKQRREYKTPTNYERRVIGHDPKTGKVLTYDQKPRVELIDDKAGKYAFKWVGYDGKEKLVVFQRGDVLDVVVSASVSKISDDRFLYTYTMENLPTSGTYLKWFVVQNFAADVTPDKGQPFIPYTMSNSIYQFREGNWRGFADASDDVQIDPGQTVQVKLNSSAPPGLVECRASIETTMDGAGEDMPLVLENLLPGYEDSPKGYTIGPVENLRRFSSQERVKYLLDKLPQFRKVGWINDDAFSRYEQFLKSNRLDAIFGQIDQDLKSEQITTEVFAIIDAMK